MTEQKNETPKRKRRTKAEIEAARAAGETPVKRTNKKVEEAPKNEEQAPKAPEEHAAKPTKQPAERSVLIMACLEPEVSKKAIDAAKEKGVEVEFKPVKVSGGAEIKKTMTMAKAGKLNGNFIEGMMCEGGCINGAAKVVSSVKAKANCVKNNKEREIKSVMSNKILDEFDNISLKK